MARDLNGIITGGPYTTGMPAWFRRAGDARVVDQLVGAKKLERLLTEYTVQFIGVADLERRPIYINSAGMAMMGLDDERMKTVLVEDFFFPEDRDELMGPFFDHVLKYGAGETEVRFRHFQTGEPIWMNYALFTIKNDAGDVVAIATTSTDISRLKATTTALRSQETELEGMFSSSAVGMTRIDPSGRFIRVNDRFCEMIGRDRQTLLTLRPMDITHPEDRAADAEALAGLVAGAHDEFQREKRFIRGDGSVIWMHLSVGAIRDAQGAYLGAVGVVQDISRRRAIQENLRLREEEFRITFENAAVGIAHKSLDGRWLRVNDRLCEIVGYSRAELLEVTFKDITPPEDLAEDLALFDDLLAGRISSYNLEKRYIHKDGTPIWINLTASLPRDTPVADPYVICVIEDISERKALEQRLRDTAAELSTLNRRKDEFLAMLAHELRNPLAPIRTGVALLRDEDDAAARRTVLETMSRQVTQVVRMVDDLLDVARISQGRVTMRDDIVDINEVVTDAAEANRPFMMEKRQELNITLWCDTPWVRGDHARLVQVISNLLHNASKYTPQKGTIDVAVHCEEGGSAVTVAVKDSGRGLSEEDVKQIFDLFAQVGEVDDTQGSGLGIGLTTAKSFIELHGGSIAVESPGLDAGATFTVTLPMTDAPCDECDDEDAGADDSRDAARDEAEETSARALAVLVVDDNQAAVQLLAAVIRQMGHSTTVAFDGRAAVAAVREARPDVILMDIGMPEMNGYEAARAIRDLEGAEAITMIALTGWGQQSDKDRAMEAGFDQHLVKPADPDVIDNLLASIASDHPNSRA